MNEELQLAIEEARRLIEVRQDRLVKLIELGAPDVVLANERRNLGAAQAELDQLEAQ